MTIHVGFKGGKNAKFYDIQYKNGQRRHRKFWL